MNKIKVLLHALWYPFTLTHYVKFALERREDIELKTVGIFTGASQPYNGGMLMPSKYVVAPDVILPFQVGTTHADYKFVENQLGDWKPDMVLTGNSVAPNWKTKPDPLTVTIGTDPHVLEENGWYGESRKTSDYFFNMQEVYMKEGDIYLPYAYDPKYHCDQGYERPYDVAMIGLKYGMREEIYHKLIAEGISVMYETGKVLDEYRELNNLAKIGINAPSLDDLNARAFEIPQMGQIEVMRPVTDCFKPRHKYFERARMFHTADEAVRQVKWCLENYKEAKQEADLMKQEMSGETYDARVEYLLQKVGLV